MNRLSIKDFANLLGTKVTDFDNDTKSLIRSCDFKYRKIFGEERDDAILDVISRIFVASIVGEHRKDIWENGWGENLKEFKESEDVSCLTPKYIRSGEYKRLFKDYVMPNSESFELDIYRVFCDWFFKKYLADADYIFEFGCGTGHNLYRMAKLFPQKKLFGLDWSNNSVKLVNAVAKSKKINMRGVRFDMFHPNKKINVPKNSIFFSAGSFEQINDRYDEMFNFIISKKPMLCVQSEPLDDLYDKDNLVDHLAWLFHTKRDYLANYCLFLEDKEKQGLIEIIKKQRIEFGGLMQEGFSYIIWRPL